VRERLGFMTEDNQSVGKVVQGDAYGHFIPLDHPDFKTLHRAAQFGRDAISVFQGYQVVSSPGGFADFAFEFG